MTDEPTKQPWIKVKLPHPGTGNLMTPMSEETPAERNHRQMGTQETQFRGDPRFHALLRKLGELHDKKQQDYGSGSDPLANIRGAEDWGVAPWIGAMVRINDKIRRLKTFVRNGTLANEGVVDSLLDIAVYALLAIILFDEQCKGINGRYLGHEPDCQLCDDRVPHLHPNEKRER